MNSNSFDLDAYLARVGLASSPKANDDGLLALHGAQFFAIPFENLDIQLGRQINLDANSLQRKLVDHRRGGYCFELGGLALLALRALGFEVRPLLARVHLGDTISARTHQLDLVTVNESPWIFDVGFGAGGPRSPMPLEEGRVEERGGWVARLIRREPWGWLMQTLIEDEWVDSYSFTLGHVTAQDIALGNFYTSHSPDCHFTRQRVASAPREQGRISLMDFTLTEIGTGGKRIREISPGAPYIAALAELFGIDLDARYEEFADLPE